MKKLLLLLFIPFVSFGQDLDFDDIKQIDSEKQFKKVMFEKEFVNVEITSYSLAYAFNYFHSRNKASVWATFFPPDDSMQFQFVKNTDNTTAKTFTRILEQVKRECSFYDIINDYLGNEYFCYTCPNSKYKGKIGFRRGDEGSDFIETFIFD